MTFNPTPGARLVKATISFYASVRPGEIVEIPAEIAEMAIRSGAAIPVDTLDERLQALPAAAAGVRRWVDPDGPSAPRTDLPAPARPPESGKGSSKAAWFEYAVSQGAKPTAAEKLTRDELIEQYGGT